MKNNDIIVHVTESGDEIPTEAVLQNESHFLSATIDPANKDIYLSFSSRLAMYDFARSVLHESLFGSAGRIEFKSLSHGERLLVSDGVRLDEKSSRIFVDYPDDTPMDLDE